ncbi:hypothetical protein [Vibrio parahaemolyticus]|uniref:hypothetical protein n=1 Tax=Vibrio parahaemolyticus TaxID=670 RepID=UPI00186AB2A0|nr:hypothetical protein [Vibrio parahaemolyticus]MBE4463013.1 hypothetical protein [Vibrio parahaemolyticus]
MIREDISYNLVHLCKGDGNNEAKRRENAAKSFLDIVTSEKLVGGTGFIKGQYKCICMSETPPKTLANILSQKEGSEFKYQPYGIMFEKSYIYSLGGLPAIYSPEADFDKLHDDHKFRHVTFDLTTNPVSDFSWEREWRLKIDELTLDPNKVWLVVPDATTYKVLSEQIGGT